MATPQELLEANVKVFMESARAHTPLTPVELATIEQDFAALKVETLKLIDEGHPQKIALMRRALERALVLFPRDPEVPL